VVAITNPKSYLFFCALLPQFIDPVTPQWPQFAVLALIFLSAELVIMLGYALLGAKAVHWLKGRGAIRLERFCGGALLASAGVLAFARRASVPH
jgi:threonine/homoserine/homoserine lactone efflux protein